MGFGFKKSIKIAPGIKLNIGKKSAGISIGGKAGGVSINSKTGTTVRTSIPGTGISYSTKVGGSKQNTSAEKKSTVSKKSSSDKVLYQQMAQNDLRILKESAVIVQETLKPDVFFSRMDLLLETSEHLASLEPYISVSGGSPTEAFSETKRQYQQKVKEFILRYYSDAYDKAKALKTRSGKENRMKKTYDALMQYETQMSEDNAALAETMYTEFMSNLK